MAGNVEWTKPEKKKLKALAKAGADPDEFERSLPGRSWTAARHKMHALGLDVAWREKRASSKPVAECDHQPPDFGSPPEERIDTMAYLEEAERRTKTRPKTKDYWRIVIETDLPIAIMKAADFHFGGLDVDYASLKDHIALLLEVPQMYGQFYGDLENYMAQHRNVATRRDVMNPDEQADFDRQFVHDMLDAGKLVSTGDGNHDAEFTERTAGISLKRLLTDRGVPFFRGLGYIDLVLKMSDGTEQTYHQGFVHKSRFYSFMNPVHGAIRMDQLHAHFFGRDRPHCHEYVTAHHHDPAHMTWGLTPEDCVHFVRVGTFKTDCTYSQRFYGQGRIGVPTIVYHPDRHESICLHNPWQAYRYMTGEDWV